MKNIIKYTYKKVILINIFLIIYSCNGFCQTGIKTIIEIPSSFNPVGSGARAIGMGGAFIGVADDATAASWNPGGLTQLLLPEISFVSTYTNRKESLKIVKHPEASNVFRISDTDITFFSATYPFFIAKRNMVLSLTYQRLYEMNRKWKQKYLETIEDIYLYDFNKEYLQIGSLSALGISYCIEIVPDFSLGMTLNIWDDDISNSHWTQSYNNVILTKTLNNISILKVHKNEEYFFKGINYNFGLLWNINKKITLGSVLKTSFWADIEHKIHRNDEYLYPLNPENNERNIKTDIKNEKFRMPLSFGIGLVYRFSDSFYISGDFYKTNWNKLSHINQSGYESNPISEKSTNDSRMDATNQIRIGAEYLILNKYKRKAIALRGGLFYDPAPSVGNPDEYYGFSLGFGYTLNGLFSFDTAYQFRFGSNVGQEVLEEFKHSQDIREHKIYFSIILYLL